MRTGTRIRSDGFGECRPEIPRYMSLVMSGFRPEVYHCRWGVWLQAIRTLIESMAPARCCRSGGVGWHQDWGIEIIRAAMGVEAGGYLDRPEEELLDMFRFTLCSLMLRLELAPARFRKLTRVLYAAHALGSSLGPRSECAVSVSRGGLLLPKLVCRLVRHRRLA